MSEHPSVRAVFGATVSEDGHLVFDEPAVTVARLLRMFKGKRVDVRVETERKPGSNEQLAYYFGMVVPVCQALLEEQGYEAWEATKDYAHAILKGRLLLREVKLPDGTTGHYIPSLRDLDMKARAEFIDGCCRWLASQGWYVPQAGEAP